VKITRFKLSQGAKPDMAACLPCRRCRIEIARARVFEAGVDCISPARHHAAFSTPMACSIRRATSVNSRGQADMFKLCIRAILGEFSASRKALKSRRASRSDFIVVDARRRWHRRRARRVQPIMSARRCI